MGRDLIAELFKLHRFVIRISPAFSRTNRPISGADPVSPVVPAENFDLCHGWHIARRPAIIILKGAWYERFHDYFSRLAVSSDSIHVSISRVRVVVVDGGVVLIDRKKLTSSTTTTTTTVAATKIIYRNN